MKKIILIAFFLMCIVGSASAYQLYLSCPESVQVGLPLKCSIDSNFPAGTTFDVVVYQSGIYCNSSQTPDCYHPGKSSHPVPLLDTKGLPGGQYKVEIQFIGPDEGRLSTDSVTLQLPRLIDRSSEITITSPMTQPLTNHSASRDLLRKWEMKVFRLKSGDRMVLFSGPSGWYKNIQSGAGEFTQQVIVTSPETMMYLSRMPRAISE